VALELAGDPDIKNIIRQSESAPLTLPATRAEIESRTAHYNYGHDIRHGDFIEDLRSSADRVSWHFSLNRAGRYRVVAVYAVQTSEAGSHFTAQIDGLPPLNATTQATADWQGALLDVRSKPGSTGEANDNRWTFKANDLGTVVFDAVGEHTLVINPKTIAKDYLFYLKSVTLAPVGP
jgi:hypothetical protein